MSDDSTKSNRGEHDPRAASDPGASPHADSAQNWKLFYTGPVINAETLVMMLEKHGIAARHELVDPADSSEDDLNRPAKVFVAPRDYDRAYQLFYSERQDEL